MNESQDIRRADRWQTATPRGSIPLMLRGAIIERYGRTCQYCGAKSDRIDVGPCGEAWHIDHIMPLLLGGTNEESNLTLSCAQCNRKKNAAAPEDNWQERKSTSRGFRRIRELPEPFRLQRAINALKGVDSATNNEMPYRRPTGYLRAVSLADWMLYRVKDVMGAGDCGRLRVEHLWGDDLVAWDEARRFIAAEAGYDLESLEAYRQRLASGEVKENDAPKDFKQCILAAVDALTARYGCPAWLPMICQEIGATEADVQDAISALVAADSLIWVRAGLYGFTDVIRPSALG